MSLPKLLTPYRGIFLHLLLTGIPHRFGLLLTGWWRGWLYPEWLMGPACSIFQDPRCSNLETFAVGDLGVRVIFYYELSWIVYCTMRINNASALAFHKILLATSTAALLALCCLQYSWTLRSILPKTLVLQELLSPQFFNTFVVCHVLAIAVSTWMIAVYPKVELPSVKWSIPGNAIFTAAVVNVYVAIAAGQAVLTDFGIQRWYRHSITPVVRFCFALSAVYTLLHAVLLLRVRGFLNRRQLQLICLYKVVLNLVMPNLWLPEKNKELMTLDHRLAIVLRTGVTLLYLLGFLLAGQAERFSRALTGGSKDD